MLQAISPFLTMFSILHGTYFPFYMHFKMLSAICFHLDQSKILSPGKGLSKMTFENNVQHENSIWVPTLGAGVLDKG